VSEAASSKSSVYSDKRASRQLYLAIGAKSTGCHATSHLIEVLDSIFRRYGKAVVSKNCRNLYAASPSKYVEALKLFENTLVRLTKPPGAIIMRAMRAEAFNGYHDLNLVEAAKPSPAKGRVLVRITAAGVTPLDHTILFGGLPRAKAPLILGNEGAGIVEDSGDSAFPVGTRVMFFGPYGVSEDGTYGEWIAARPEDLCPIPDGLDDATAAGAPVAYLTAQITLVHAGFERGKTVLAPAIGGSVGNAVTQLARAQWAKYAISTTTSASKAEQAKAMGYEQVIDLSRESLADGVKRITAGQGADIVIDSVGGALTGQALSTLALNGVVTTSGYAAGRTATIDLTDLIWKRARVSGFSLFAQPPAIIAAAWQRIVPLFASQAAKPVLDKAYPLEQAAEAMRHLVEDRPFGRVVLRP
jgi:NADPH:quinone reductase